MDDNAIKLRDGRKLGFCEYGKPDGIPLMLFHGTPGSRVLPSLERAEWVRRLGFRVLTPERPGYGLSDSAPGHTISDWPDDVVQLADQLGLDRFHVSGGSGGGPFALACALRLPGRVRSATLFCSGCPPEAMRDRDGMNLGNRLVFFLARYVPPLLKVLMALYARGVTKPRKPKSEAAKKKRDEKKKKRMLAQLCAWDRRVFESREHDPRAKLHLTEAFRQGPSGAYHDMMLVSHAWGLDFQSLEVPVFLWHGTADTLMPASCARAFAAMIPGCEAHFIENAGHMLLASDDVSAEMMGRIASIADQDVFNTPDRE
jgi:pimeloyl-ACP methyl ester carboxylesterase